MAQDVISEMKMLIGFWLLANELEQNVISFWFESLELVNSSLLGDVAVILKV